MSQWIGKVVGGLRLQKAKRQHLRGGYPGAHKAAALDKVTPIEIVIHSLLGEFPMCPDVTL
jgi:hypothetical protein